MDEFIPCTMREATGAYPCDGDGCPLPTAEYIAVVQSKWWGSSGVHLGVCFMEPAPDDLKRRILSHMNAWNDFCNVRFELTDDTRSAHVRITREQEGYWSYLGRDILGIPRNQPTMCLQGFSMQTPASEFVRVVRHETGHALGAPHEHARSAIVRRLNPLLTIQWGRERLGWSEQMVRSQILTPLNEASLFGTPDADQDSIMCYQLPGSITFDGQPVRGGSDFTESDKAFFASLYPLPNKPKPKPSNGVNHMAILAVIRNVLVIAGQAAKFTQTTADDKIISGLIELIDLYTDSTVTTDKKAAANVIVARMF